MSGATVDGLLRAPSIESGERSDRGLRSQRIPVGDPKAALAELALPEKQRLFRRSLAAVNDTRELTIRHQQTQ